MKIGIVGGGTMGFALGEAILKQMAVPPGDLTVIETLPEIQSRVADRLGCAVAGDCAALDRCEVVILAIKPQDLAGVSSRLVQGVKSDALVISILAGVSLGRLEQLLSGVTALIRAMPNTPSQVGEGMTVMVCSAGVSEKQSRIAEAIFTACGKVYVLPSEELMDAVTAVSGSGPAYLYLFGEALEGAARKLGFNPDEARLLVLQTLKGAVALWERSGESPEALRQRVTSKGGTTEAALGILTEGRMVELIERALQRARDRGKELNTLS